MTERRSRPTDGGAAHKSLPGDYPKSTAPARHNPSLWLQSRVVERMFAVGRAIRWDGSCLVVLPLAEEFGTAAFKDRICSRCGVAADDGFKGFTVKPVPFVTFFGGLCLECDLAEWGA